jgi:hypothetical protein
MLLLYYLTRKIRAISTGVAAEYYLMHRTSWLTILVQNIIGKKIKMGAFKGYVNVHAFSFKTG